MTLAEPESVTRFRQFLQINTMHPNPEYRKCAEFLIAQGNDIGMEASVVECVEGKPIVILKLEGTEPSEKSILLSCHTDVVPVFEEYWTHPPFAADRVQAENGDFKIIARGAQDMKIGGKDGVQKLVETEEFKNLNAGFDVDEGLVSPITTSVVLYAERTTSQVVFTAHGNTGHGSQFIEGTAIEKLLPVINEMMALREKEKARLLAIDEKERIIRSGEITSVNLTQIEGGKQPNVVPATYSVTFDIRVTPLVDLEEFRKYLRDLAEKNGVEFKLLHPDEERTISKMDRANVFIDKFFNVLESRGINYAPMICPGATDARYVRNKGIPAFGFNPMQKTTTLAHDHDEFVWESEYIKGIEVYVDLIQNLANV
ncbi:Aminoacylase-1 [Smittium culicis]|uniref:Aminoacylase-1 n=1 Tax=Smittium culicis TaxID=133412 RepID=A0A1R1XBR5_9FUNG|nr:Aminoacylase-1 [Smittium culicis]